MLSKENLKFIKNHIEYLSDKVNTSLNIVLITGSSSQNKGIKLCDFKQKLRGTSNPINFDHHAITELLNTIY